MNIIKNKTSENKDELILINESGNKFIIHYAGGDLYWTMLDYCYDNQFCVTGKEELLFSQLENLFCEIECDKNLVSKLLKDNCFEWISEAYGVPEESHKLTILKDKDKFTIKFFQNHNKRFYRRDVCAICFCLNGSKYQDVANKFSLMFYEYIEADNNKTKILK